MLVLRCYTKILVVYAMDWQTFRFLAGDAGAPTKLTHSTPAASTSLMAAEKASMSLSPPLPDSPTVNCQ